MDSTFCRRTLIQAGGAAGAAVWLGMDASSAFAAPGNGTDSSTGASILRRSTYAGLIGHTFGATALVSGVVVGLRLSSVADLPAAGVERKLQGHEEAFALTFSPSGRPLESGIYQLEHPELGQFELFLSPVGADHAHEAVINRTVKLETALRRAPEPDPVVAAAAAPAPLAASGTAPPAGAKAPKKATKWLRRATARRLRDRLVADVELARTGGPVTVALVRGKTVYARGRGSASATRLTVPMRAMRRVPAGRYDLVVSFTRSSGTRSKARTRITLR